MPKKYIIIGLLLLSIPAIIILGYFGTAVLFRKTADEWFVTIDGKQIPVSLQVVEETKEMPPFMTHLEEYQKVGYFCNCIVDSADQIPGGMGGTFSHGSRGSQKNYYWRLPLPDDPPFRLRHVEHALICQNVTYQWSSHSTLDWRIEIEGFLSDDGKYYYLRLSRIGGNFAITEVDYYVDYNPETMRLILHVRQKLPREKFKRYQLEFELQDNPAPTGRTRSYYGGEPAIPSMFVPVDLVQ